MAESHSIISRKEAQAQGLKRYFSGKPCIWGHIDWRQVSSNQCMECDRQQAFKWRKENPDLARIKDRKNTLKNGPTINQKTRAWYQRNKEHACLWAKNWRAKNKEQKRALDRNRKIRLRGNGGKHTGAEILDIFKMQNGKCAYFSMCRTKLSSKSRNWEVDHIIPLSKGGTNDRRNLQILCLRCNDRKSAYDPIEFMRSQGALL